MAFWSAANLSAEECNVTTDFHEYFDSVYNGTCMEHHNSLIHCSFPWVSLAFYSGPRSGPLQMVYRFLTHQNITNPKIGHYSLYPAVHHILDGSCCAKFLTTFRSLHISCCRVSNMVY